MSDWLDFLKTTVKLKRKNKKLTFIKKPTQVYVPKQEDEYVAPQVSKIVDNFSKNEKRKFYTQATLDLHGYHEKEAIEAIIHFLKLSKERGYRNVLIITGGSEQDGKVLRKMFIKSVYSELSYLISKITCQPHNTGAFFVKLRKQG